MSQFPRDQLHLHMQHLADQVLPHIREDGANIWGLDQHPDVAKHPSTFFQNVHQYYLYLATRDDIPDAKRDAYRHAGLANMAFSVTRVDDQARLEIWQSGHHNLGAVRDEWHAYALLLSLEIVERDGLHCSAHGDITTYLKTYGEQDVAWIRGLAEHPTTRQFCSNHFMWRLTLVHRLGRYFDRQDWCDLANTIYWDEVLPAQTPDGCWNEFGYPTSKYHHIHASAIGSHWLLEQDHPGERAAVEGALDFCRKWSYPDATAIETIDGRVVHQPHVQPMFCPAFVHWPEGQAYLAESLASHAATPSLASVEGPGHLTWLGFFANALPTTLPVLDTPAIPLPSVVELRSHQALRVDRGKWTLAACGFSRPFSTARFCKDFQNHLSLFHREHGLLVGGGHSKRDPWLSTFAQTAGGSAYLAQACQTLSMDDDTLRLVLDYGEHQLEAQVRLIDDTHVDFTGIWLTPRADCEWEFGITIPSPAGTTWLFDDEPIIPLDTSHRVNKLKRPGQGDIVGIHAGLTQVSLADSGNVRWPTLSYEPGGSYPHATIHGAVSRVSVPLTPRRPQQCIHLTLVS